MADETTAVMLIDQLQFMIMEQAASACEQSSNKQTIM